MAETRYLYFAYGSNLWWPRMRQRCPGARAWGAATLDGYRLVERLYADIVKRTGSHVQGVLYSVTAADIASLDRFEGLAKGVYRRINVKVKYGRRTYDACTYLMTKETRAARRGKPYPAWYRNICSMGAQWHGIEDGFKVKNTSGWSLVFPASAPIDKENEDDGKEQ